jgi:hypothetical protein
LDAVRRLSEDEANVLLDRIRAVKNADHMVSATTASFRSLEKRRRPATLVITSTFENVGQVKRRVGRAAHDC